MGKQLRGLVRALVTQVPPVRELLNSRRILLAERNDALRQRDEVIAESELKAERQSLALADLQAGNQQLLENIARERDRLQRFGADVPFVPNGHFYSPVPSQDELRRDETRIFGVIPRSLPGIDLRETQQLALLEKFRVRYPDLPFKEGKVEGLRYRYENPAYSYSDAIFLNLMIRYVQPKRIVEIGSGFSSCMMLDTNELWFGNSIDCTFIEPYPELLHSLLKDGDLDRIRVIPSRVQDADLTAFKSLQGGDVLFVDSTHVSKIGSDVNHILFNVLPSLASGVYVHFHDIFYPFEYPKAWAMEGRSWNEAYLLHSFLQNNSAFEIVAFNTFLEHFHRDFFEAYMPLCLKNPGASIWLRKR